jgi:transposase
MQQGNPLEELNVSKSGAQKVIHDWKDDSILHIAPRTGGPQKLTESGERCLLLQSKRDPHATVYELAAFFNLKVSDCLVGDTLRKHNLFVRVCRRKPWLNRENCRKKKSLPDDTESAQKNDRERIFIPMKFTFGYK